MLCQTISVGISVAFAACIASKTSLPHGPERGRRMSDDIDARFKRRDDVGSRVGMGENRFGGAMRFLDARAYRVRRELTGSWCREKELERVHALREQLLRDVAGLRGVRDFRKRRVHKSENAKDFG